MNYKERGDHLKKCEGGDSQRNILHWNPEDEAFLVLTPASCMNNAVRNTLSKTPDTLQRLCRVFWVDFHVTVS